MSETEVLTIQVLLAVCAGLLLLLLVMAIGSSRRLRRIERSLKTRDITTDAAASVAGVSVPRGEFETFLAEDPARQQLSKGEQFKAYRRWRQDKGLNWSKP